MSTETPAPPPDLYDGPRHEEDVRVLRLELDRARTELAMMRRVAQNAAIVSAQERSIRKARPATKGYRKLLRLERMRVA